jgi:two-component system, cell cycle response regulator DivK
MTDWHDLANSTILLVDDEPDNLEVVAETLEYNGLKVMMAENGVEAVEILKTAVPGLILTDLSMPKMDGWQLRTRVKTNPTWQHIPVIALSAHAMAGDKERALNAGFDGYMTKPVNILTLISDLQQVLNEINSQGAK